MSEGPVPTARKNGKNALEWAVFSLSCLLIAGMLAVLVKETTVWTGRPPELTTRLGLPEMKNGHITVTVEVTNHGDVAAAGVRLELTRTEAGVEQRAFLWFDFVPRQGTRRGHASFPAATGEPGSIQIAGIGFAEP